MISSAQNTQVKNIIKLNQKAKVRREQGLFIAEGRKMFLEAPDDWIEKIYVAESMLEDEEVMKKVRRFSWDAVENGVCSGRCVIHRRHRESLPYSDSLLTNWKIF